MTFHLAPLLAAARGDNLYALAIRQVFAATWLDNDRVLLAPRITNSRCTECRRRMRHGGPPAVSRRSGAATTTHNLNARPGSVGLWRRHTTADEPEELSDDESGETTLTAAMENCGIHAIAVNPSGTRMVTGASNPNDAAVFTLPELLPTAMCVGHSDWVFGLDWITDNIFASGSRSDGEDLVRPGADPRRAPRGGRTFGCPRRPPRPRA